MRRALLRALLAVYGGLPPRRPDQVSTASAAGVAPGTATGTLRARLVEVFGPGAGVFLYSSAPAHGDLVESVTEATSDPFSNTTQPGFGSYDNVFGGVAQLHGALLKLFGGGVVLAQLGPGGLSAFNSHGALIFSIDTARDGWFLYADTGSAAQGALLVSCLSAAGTDSFGNHTVGPGMGVYTTSTAMQFAGSQGIQAYTGSLAAGWTAGAANISPANSAAEYAVKGPLVLEEQASPGASVLGPRVFGGSSDGMLQFVSDSTNGDSVAYVAGHAITPNTVAVGLVATGFTNIFGGRTVAAISYRVRAHLIVTIGATATALRFQLTGPAVGANTNVKWWLTIEAGAGQSVFAGHSLGSLASVLLPSGTTVGAGGVCHIWLESYVQFSAAGTLNLQGETSVAASTATVAIGCELEVSGAS